MTPETPEERAACEKARARLLAFQGGLVWADAYGLCICGRDNQTYCDYGKYEAGVPPCARAGSEEGA
jgi:hypothetical protein